MSDKNDRQLIAARRIVSHLADLLDADLYLRLWNGEKIDLGSAPATGPGIAVRSPDVFSRLLRRPRFNTIIELYASGDLDIEGGTLLDIAHRRGKMRTKSLLRRLDKSLLLKSLLPFLLSGNKKSDAVAETQAYTGRIETSVDKGRDDKALIHFHYDLSNAFYALFLDPRMVYTCAYFPQWDATIEAAQEAKLDIVCRKLRLQPGEKFLDIGCGWGGLVIHAAQNFGVEAHGVTLSEEQFAFAQERIKALGLQDRVTVELKDYRHIDAWGAYDKIASVGMFEAVGIDNHDAYFTQMHALLRPRGLYLHHSIARPAKRNMKKFRRQRAEYKALTTYIFPGGELDTIGMSLNGLESHGFEVHDVEALREHYQRTCRIWTERLYANREAAAAEAGWPKTRLWLLYLAGCSLAFERSAVGIFQTLASRKDKGPGGLPSTRASLYQA
ncbi:MAG: class I SAM-dependent methyltransferase [Hyphomicrobiales bacterium]|nr:class I SAM-dependent methyltransferase [Hyphomicrobiales bacterium]